MKAQVRHHALPLGTSGVEGAFHAPAVFVSGILGPQPVWAF
jgi:hypothetical protein